jgi:hypothetical protein
VIGEAKELVNSINTGGHKEGANGLDLVWIRLYSLARYDIAQIDKFR